MFRKKSKLASKRGRYGASKVKAFQVLVDFKGWWLSARLLCFYTGIGYRSLAGTLAKWCRYGYLERRVCAAWATGDYEYQISERGRSWLKVASRDLRNYGLFLSEVAKWQHAMPKEKDAELLRLPFLSFVSVLDEVIRQHKAGNRLADIRLLPGKGT